METVILVSVLSTIGVVAVLLSVAVAFIKLKSKVDVSQMENQIRAIYDRTDHIDREHRREIDHLYQKLEHDNNSTHQIIDNARSNLYGYIDSRSDKLESKIKLLTPSEKDK